VDKIIVEKTIVDKIIVNKIIDPQPEMVWKPLTVRPDFNTPPSPAIAVCHQACSGEHCTGQAPANIFDGNSWLRG
jgi:hypothetical protein